jgi:hypothetical protein
MELTPSAIDTEWGSQPVDGQVGNLHPFVQQMDLVTNQYPFVNLELRQELCHTQDRD